MITLKLFVLIIIITLTHTSLKTTLFFTEK